jgi:hypothetical protein
MGPPPSPGCEQRGGRPPPEYKVRLTHVASINPEYDIYSPPRINSFSRLLESFRVSYGERLVMITPY